MIAFFLLFIVIVTAILIVHQRNEIRKDELVHHNLNRSADHDLIN